ncbi:MAG: LysM peptidoglycan-binding domain-containing protein [Streptococcaceae bacterium]|jgi:LysM repeat protein|nr:LysM peptidoglycan-binding domain-containing protein [Streptococcaceae bacterium]
MRSSPEFKTFYQHKWQNAEEIKSAEVTPMSVSVVPAESAVSETPTYTIQAGDTAYSIAAANEIGLDDLYVANPTIWNSDGSYVGDEITPGQVINLPKDTQEAAFGDAEDGKIEELCLANI